jgi:hypothetical protein
LYAAVSDAVPFPTVAPVYETVTGVDAFGVRNMEAGETPHELSTAEHDGVKAAVALSPPVFVTVNW